jgi:DNA-binding NarL/FixJ family response regulator
LWASAALRGTLRSSWLHISCRTVERHRENSRAKLGMTDRIPLTRNAIRRGLIDP